jgi:hypothetical protein
VKVVLVDEGGLCVDLAATFGKSYRTGWEDGASGLDRDPWRRILPGKNGFIYPHGGRKLGAWLNAGHPKLKTRLRALGETSQEGDEEVTVLFGAEAYRPVFGLLGIYRKRRASEAQLANLAGGAGRLQSLRQNAVLEAKQGGVSAGAATDTSGSPASLQEEVFA